MNRYAARAVFLSVALVGVVALIYTGHGAWGFWVGVISLSVSP